MNVTEMMAIVDKAIEAKKYLSQISKPTMDNPDHLKAMVAINHHHNIEPETVKWLLGMLLKTTSHSYMADGKVRHRVIQEIHQGPPTVAQEEGEA